MLRQSSNTASANMIVSAARVLAWARVALSRLALSRHSVARALTAAVVIAAVTLAAQAYSSFPGNLPTLQALHAPARSQAPAQTPPRRVLFIGNSYTYFNNLPEMLRGLAASRGLEIDVQMATTGGWKLADHWTHAESAAHRLLRDRKWDIVVLQEQSTLGSTTVIDGVARVGADDQFQQYAKLWQEEIHRAGMTPAFYLTWAKKGAPQDQDALDRAYVSAARAAHALVVPVGRAWKSAREHHAGIELFQPDGSHPSPAGTYLAACTFFAALFDRSPVGLPASITGTPIDPQTAEPASNRRESLAALSGTDAAALQREAWAAWQDVKRHHGYPPVTRPRDSSTSSPRVSR
jgi:hypothetical protein